MQASIALETEKYLPAHAPLEVPADAHGTRVVNNVVGMSAVNMATTVGAKCITVPTTTGRTARLISHFRPNMPICAFSRHEWAVQQMIMYWGVIPHQAEITQGTVNGTIVTNDPESRLVRMVEHNADRVKYKNRQFRYDHIHYYRSGVYTVLYDADGNALQGTFPAEFSPAQPLPLSGDAVRTVTCG